ncbi:MAG: sigma-70 family RNA polymerase sigma factor [Oceanicoccus sp.]|uniref:sigma-70 family RNA polymerase sigma factor n=1 Tax=Oceanicoccus sp. TaxID=2691044 RepID=UPI0026103BFB|nr:sigma-70 family RNA polymerase sigma factor [Oceanicoccus sp.]MCP3907714.1 sigma-70 family RNA polymerase sigma factor [Oceanicoccus sp.]MDG1772593.1 sigma-70 family RNA polymerase sigma factor [Oceanicoccus sp.]
MSTVSSKAGVSNAERNARLKQLMAKVAEDRDKLAFEQLFDHFAPLLRSYSLAREPGAALLADELAQEVMIKVWNKAHTYKPDMAAVSTWIFTLARNSRIDYLRRNGRFSTEIDPTEIFNNMEDEGPDPFQLAQQQRVESKIHEGLKQLPIEQAQVLAKVYLEGKSHQETSDELGLPLGTVKSRVRLALQKLELLLKR